MRAAWPGAGRVPPLAAPARPRRPLAGPAWLRLPSALKRKPGRDFINSATAEEVPTNRPVLRSFGTCPFCLASRSLVSAEAFVGAGFCGVYIEKQRFTSVSFISSILFV